MSRQPTFLHEAVLYHDYRAGHIKDFSSFSNNGEFRRSTSFTGDGIGFGSNGSIEVANNNSLQNSEGTLIVLGNNFKINEYGVFLIKRHSSTEWYFYTTGGHLRLYDGSNDSHLFANISNSKYIAVNYKNLERPEFFVDGVSLGLGNVINSITSNTENIEIGSYNNGATSTVNSATFKAVLIFPRELTANEHAELYSYLSNLIFETNSNVFSNAFVSVQNDINLYGGYNCYPVDNELIDVSDKGNNATLTGQTPEYSLLGPAIYSDGSSSIDTGITATQLNPRTESHTVSCWVKVKEFPGASNSSTIISKGLGGGSWSSTGNGGISISSTGVLTYSHYTGVSYVSITSSPILLNHFYHLGYTVDHENTLVSLFINGIKVGVLENTTMAQNNAVDADGFRFFGLNSISTHQENLNGSIIAPQFHKSVKDTNWFESKYDKSKLVLWKMGYGIYESKDNITTGPIENTNFEMVSGSSKIVVHKDKSKWIKSISNALFFLDGQKINQSKAEMAYGTWSFDFIKNNGNCFYVTLTDERNGVLGNNGYVIAFFPSGEIILYRITNNVSTLLVRSSIGCFKKEIEVSFYMTRSLNGVFSLYLNKKLITTIEDTTYSSFRYLQFRPAANDEIKLSNINGTNALSKTFFNKGEPIEEEISSDIELRWKKMGSEFTYNVLYSKDEDGPWIQANNTRLVDSSGEEDYNIYVLDMLRHDEKYFIKVVSCDKYHQWWYSYNGEGSLQGGFSSQSTPTPTNSNTTGFQFEVIGV